MTKEPKEYTWLHAYVVSRGIIILDLSRKTEIHERTLHYYLRGWRRIPRRHVDAIAKALGVSPRLVQDDRKYHLEPTTTEVAPKTSAVT